ncbi:MAG: hypothetical protein ACHQAR_03665 [Steroidobacterales bacterium]
MHQMLKAAALLCAALALGSTGCGSSTHPGPGSAAAVQAPGSLAGAAKTDAAVPPNDADMVSAVSAANSTTPVSVKFRLEGRPQVGQPLMIELVVIPAAGAEIEHIHASFQAGEGLQLQSDRNFDAERPSAGVPLSQVLTVLPQQAGVLSLTATILVDSSSGSLARTYAIPLIALAAS